jgi:amphi-Trp domain-containing protein
VNQEPVLVGDIAPWSHIVRPQREGTPDVRDRARDIEVIYSIPEVVAKLRRLADALEQDSPFRIQIAGERIWVPARATFSVEHERGDDEEAIEFQFTWPTSQAPVSESSTDPVV